MAGSEVNGNVDGHYKIIRQFRQNVTLLFGEELEKAVSDEYDAVPLRLVLAEVQRYTDKPIRSTEMAYYDHEIFWVITFVGSEYVLLSSKATILPEARQQLFQTLLDKDFPKQKLIDLEAEIKARQRKIAARKSVIVFLALNGGNGKIEDFLASSNNYTLLELKDAADELDGEGIITKDNDILHLPDNPQNIQQIIKVYEELLNHYVMPEVLGCTYYDTFINDTLLLEIQRLQSNLKLSVEQAQTVLQLIKLSPSALAYALTPNQSIISHQDTLSTMPTEQRELVESNDTQYFLWGLHECLLMDFRMGNGLWRYFYEVRQFKEVETKQEFILKNVDDTIHSSTTREHISIGLFDPMDGSGRTGYVKVRVLDNPVTSES